MILYPINELMHNLTSRYELVNVVAHRAREIASEAEKDKEPLTEKPVTMALNQAWAGDLATEETETAEPAEAEADTVEAE